MSLTTQQLIGKVQGLKVIVLVAVMFIYCSEVAAQTKIIIIRHAEKPAEGYNLSCKGLNRALALPEVLSTKFGVPSYAYASSVNNGQNTASVRMLQTITPVAVKYNLNINTKYADKEEEKLAANVKQKKGLVLVVWEHKSIPKLARALGVNEQNLKWDGNDYDSIWIVDLLNGEARLTMDKQNLHPSENCK